MKKMIFIKFGGSIITDKNQEEKVNLDSIDNLSKQVSEILNKEKDIKIMIGNGAGSFGHMQVERYKLNNGVKTSVQKLGVTKVQELVARLNQMVVKSLTKHNLPAVSIKPSSIITTSDKKIHNLPMDPLINYLNDGYIPVIYGDMVKDLMLGAIVMSTDRLFFETSKLFYEKDIKIDKIIFCGSTKGVLDLGGNTIDVITKESFPNIKNVFFENRYADVTGSMKKKVETALRITEFGIKSYIIDIASLSSCVLDNKFFGTVIK